jgi:Holliday junction resolvase-like predicted endonuclease
MSKPISPFFTIDQSALNRAIFHAWPKGVLKLLDGKENVQDFYNKVYSYFDEQLNSILTEFHPAGVIIEAYKQLEIWTAIYHNKKEKFRVDGPKEFAPIGRYGWRYVIEKSLERLSSGYKYSILRPSSKDQEAIFTILWGLSYSSELSNALHFLGEHASSVFIEFDVNLLNKFFQFEIEAEQDLFNAIIESLSNKIDWDSYPQFGTENPVLVEKTNEFLIRYYQLTLDDLTYFAVTLIDKVCSWIQASIVVQPYDEFVDMMQVLTNFSKTQVTSIINLAFLSIDKDNYEVRNYLKKSQPIRMVNHGGVILQLENDFEAIYDPASSQRLSIRLSPRHVIISPSMFAEWIDIFETRIALGQRTDLKEDANMNESLSDIEHVFRRRIFENEVKNLCRNFGYESISIDKLNGKDIACGEIDIVAYNPQSKILLIIECKNIAPSIDFKGCRQVHSDHFKQKKYHQKFIKKIKWVHQNLDAVRQCFQEKTDVKINSVTKFEEVFITGSDYIAKFFADDYKIMTFYEWNDYLKEQNEKDRTT